MKKFISCLAVFVLLMMNNQAFALGSGESIFNSLSLKKRTDDPATATGEGKIYYKSAGAPSYDSNTKLMLHMDGSGTSFTDSSSSGYTVNTNGDATQTSTPASPLTDGNNVASFDGAGDYLSVPDSADWDFGAGDFTIDMWLWFDSVTGGEKTFFEQGNGTIRINYYPSGGGILVYVAGGPSIFNNTVQWPWSPVEETWYHIAFVRTGNDFKFFVDGSQIGSTKTSSGAWADATTSLFIGSDFNGNANFPGYIDEFRISKGIARWTSNFPKPTKSYGSSSNEGLYFKDENGVVTPIIEILP